MVKERVPAILHGVKNFAVYAGDIGFDSRRGMADTRSGPGLPISEGFASLSFHSAERVKETT